MPRHHHDLPFTHHTLTIQGIEVLIYPGVPPQWEEIAPDKGFDLVCRVKDRYHVALRCHACEALSCTRVFVLTTHAPRCPACLQAGWTATAAAAGLTFLRRDPDRRHYFVFRALCGHEVTRQMELVRRVSAGITDLRCETCLLATEKAEAQARGWIRLGPDPEGNQDYRLYRHECGHTQRVARINMRSGRFGCGNCDPGWVAAPSWLYAMRFTLPGGEQVVKLGFSRDPASRLHFQLTRGEGTAGLLLKQVRMRTGQIALRTEKRLHIHLRETYLKAVVAPARFETVINVGSEIYEGWLEPVILKLLDDLDHKAGRIGDSDGEPDGDGDLEGGAGEAEVTSSDGHAHVTATAPAANPDDTGAGAPEGAGALDGPEVPENIVLAAPAAPDPEHGDARGESGCGARPDGNPPAAHLVPRPDGARGDLP